MKASGWARATALLFGGYFLSGVFGRQPWKADEPYSFGLVWSMLTRGDWLIPHVAGEPFVEKPPLVYWLGAWAARMLPGVEAHEASRLAVIGLVGLIVASIGWIAIRLEPEARLLAPGPVAVADPASGRPARATVALLGISALVGTVGFAEHLHKLLADVGQLAGAAIGLAGLVRLASGSSGASRASRRGAGLLLGLGVAMAFLSKGPLVPGILGLATVALLAVGPRRRATVEAALTATAIAVPLILGWLIPFWRADPALFHEWWWDHNLGRYLGQVDLGGRADPLASRIVTIVGLGLPISVAAVWLIGRILSTPGRRDRLAAAAGFRAVGCYLGAASVALLAAGRLRDVYVLPVLLGFVPFALPMLIGLPGRLSRFGFGLAVALGLVATAAVWGVWAGLVTSGLPGLPGLLPARLFGQMPARFEMPLSPVLVGAAVAALVAWTIAITKAPMRNGLLGWSQSFALVWITVATLWLPWIDAGRSHAEVFRPLLPALALADRCVATHYLGESERAMLDYVARRPLIKSFLGHSAWGDTSRPNPAAAACDVVIVAYRHDYPVARMAATDWEVIATIARPTASDESYRVFRRRGPGSPVGPPIETPPESPSP